MAALFEFRPDKSLATIAYLAQQSGETMYTILKMIYLADRLHLERYGRPITGDTFIAMEQGACPSRIYDTFKVLRGDTNTNHLAGSEHHIEVNAETYDVSIRLMPSLDDLSATDMECLDEVLETLRQRGRWVVRDEAHDLAWKKTDRNSAMDFLAIARATSSGEVLVDHLKARFSDKT